MAILLFYLGGVLVMWSGIDGLCILFLMSYLLLNLLYTFFLKNLPIIDIMVLGINFLIRVLYGAALAEVVTSDWLYLTVLTLSFYLAFGKRRNELAAQGDISRKVLKFYNKQFLDKNMYMFLAMSNTFYALWCCNHESRGLIWTVPVFMFICMKYSLDIEGGVDGDPVEVLLGDKSLLLLVGGYGLLLMLILYIK